MGNYCVDAKSLIMSRVSSELIAPKYFASNKKMEQLFSYNCLDQVNKATCEAEIIGLEGDFGVLCTTWCLSRLHLRSVNAVNAPAKHRDMCLGFIMFWFTSVWGINQLTKRNMIMESIGNTFLGKLYVSYSVSFLTLFPFLLVLRDDINKLTHCTSEPCEHMFGNMRQSDREFNCSDFPNHVDKQNRRVELTHKSDLSMAK